MAITTVLFDLDGTLLPMDLDIYIKDYFGRLAAYFARYGYESAQLMREIRRGISAMVNNDGSKTNEEAFWEHFRSVYGEKAILDKPIFDNFYETEYDKVSSVCGYTPASAEILRMLKEKGLRIVLATNPLFPACATRRRIKWAGLSPEDFEIYTTYENSRFSKPNLKYYQAIMEPLGVKAEECVMVGNDVGEDMIAAGLGMKVFLLTDCLINSVGADINQYPHGDFEALRGFLSEL